VFRRRADHSNVDLRVSQGILDSFGRLDRVQSPPASGVDALDPVVVDPQCGRPFRSAGDDQLIDPGPAKPRAEGAAGVRVAENPGLRRPAGDVEPRPAWEAGSNEGADSEQEGRIRVEGIDVRRELVEQDGHVRAPAAEEASGDGLRKRLL